MQTTIEELLKLNPINENVYILPIILLILLLLLINFIIIHIHSSKKIKHLQNVKTLNEKIIETYKTKNIKYTSREDIELYNSIKNSFDIIMKEKMDFYFNRFFLPKYIGKKEIDKKLITEIKEKFYTDVMFSTPEFIKNDLQDLYSKKAFDAYILQFYFNYLNNVDRKMFQITDNMSDDEIKDIVQLGKY